MNDVKHFWLLDQKRVRSGQRLFQIKFHAHRFLWKHRICIVWFGIWSKGSQFLRCCGGASRCRARSLQAVWLDYFLFWEWLRRFLRYFPFKRFFICIWLITQYLYIFFQPVNQCLLFFWSHYIRRLLPPNFHFLQLFPLYQFLFLHHLTPNYLYFRHISMLLSHPLLALHTTRYLFWVLLNAHFTIFWGWGKEFFVV